MPNVTPAQPLPAARRVAVLWMDNERPDVRAMIEPVLSQCFALVPGWVEELTVYYDSDPQTPDAIAACRILPEYRRVAVRVFPRWFNCGPAERLETLQHEILHIAVHPMKNALDDLLDTWTDAPEPVKVWGREVFRRAMESAVCDLSHGVLRLRGVALDGGEA